MPQHGRGDGPDVFVRDEEAGPSARPGPWRPAPGTGWPAARAPQDIFLHEVGRVGFLAARQAGELHGVAGDMIGHRHLADDARQRGDLLGMRASA